MLNNSTLLFGLNTMQRAAKRSVVAGKYHPL